MLQSESNKDQENPVTKVEVSSSQHQQNFADARKYKPVGDQVSEAAAKGVVPLLDLMKAHANDSEFQWWCCDAIASLTAGNEDARAQVFVQGGLLQVLAAQRLFMYDENVQTKAAWALASISASYADHCGKQGAVEAVIAAMTNLPESYQVLTTAVRALQNLTLTSDVNKARAKAAGCVKLIQEVLERNPEDGQLVWRGQELLKKLDEIDEETEQKLSARGATEMARASPWNKLKSAITKGQAKVISAGNVPGLYGVSAQVADAAKHGVGAVLQFMKEHPGYHDAQTWCCDALGTMMNGNEVARMEGFTGGALQLILIAMRGAVWEEELQLKAMWALLSLAPTFAVEVGEAGAIPSIVEAMYKNKTNHQVQVAGVKLISLLTVDREYATMHAHACTHAPCVQTQQLSELPLLPSLPPHAAYTVNKERAVAANAVRIIKAVIAAHTEDGTLQYRGVNLLERLQPGCTLEMPKQAMVRSYSMRAAEIVSQYKDSATSFVRSESKRMMAGAGAVAEGESDSPRITAAAQERAKLNKQAIAEVDELAEAVEDHEDGHDSVPGTVRKPEGEGDGKEAEPAFVTAQSA